MPKVSERRVPADKASLMDSGSAPLAGAIALGLALLFAMLAATWNASAGLDQQLRLIRDGLRSRPATGQIRIIEIDAKSVQAAQVWPWPRRVHGALVDQLHKAGAQTVAFDVEFSSQSNPVDDQAFGDALARFGGDVILPTFRQKESSESHRFIENLPIKPLRDQAFLGSVNVHPDEDGQMRTYSYGTITGGVPRPSIGALMAGAKGTVEESFRIDPAIEPDTIPRYSYMDVMAGKVPASALRGKTILIGATAIELNDFYPVPLHGVVPGVVVQAMAAETLLQGTTNPSLGFWPMLLAAALVGLIAIRNKQARTRWVVLASGSAMIMLTPLVMELGKIGSVDIAPSLFLTTCLSIELVVIGFVASYRKGRFTDQDSGLPNLRALVATSAKQDRATLVVIKLKQFGEMTAVLGSEERKSLLSRIEDRLRLGFAGHRVHFLQAGLLAWSLPDGEIETVVDQIEALGALFRAPLDLGPRSVLVTPAFGIAQGAGKDADQLVAQACLAGDRADENGHRWMLHNDQLTGDADRALVLLADIDTALSEGDIHVVYQPKWSLQAGRICGAEALVRWRHPILGPIAPDQFIPVLEQNGHLQALTLFVVDSCIAERERWAALGHDLGVAVNVSAALLDDMSFVPELVSRVRACGEGARALTFEVTESATIASTRTAIGTLTTLRSLGARISIDDYGTGQSTLSYIRSFPADEIKIDKSFVTRILDNSSDQILVRSTIELAHDLGFVVVAEGVEDGDCLIRLAAYNCDIAQGWHIGKPMPADDLLALIDNRDDRKRETSQAA
jgi:diguanylate cyclase